jgi:hypothetical protein
MKIYPTVLMTLLAGAAGKTACCMVERRAGGTMPNFERSAINSAKGALR